MAIGFTFFDGFWKTFQHLTEHQQIELLHAMCRYAFEGVEPDEGDGFAGTFFPLLKSSIDASMKSRKGGSKSPNETASATASATPSEGGSATPLESGSTTNKNVNRNVNRESEKEKKVNGEGSAHARFAPPTLDEVDAYANGYAAEKRLKPDAFSAERFIDYYSANGWKVGRNPMRDWKAAVRDWVRRDCEPKWGAGDEYSKL